MRRNRVALLAALIVGAILSLLLRAPDDPAERAQAAPATSSEAPIKRRAARAPRQAPPEEADDHDSPTCTFTLAVERPDGELEGLDVLLLQELNFEPHAQLRGRLDEDGEASFAELIPGFWYRANVDAEGAVPGSASAFCTDEGGALEATLTLRPALAWFEGEVTDIEGFVLDATVGIVEAEREKEVFRYPTSIETEDGRYRLGVLPGRKYNLYANADGYRFGGGITQQIDEGEVVEVDFQLKLEASIQGVVLDAEGQPVEGATVHRYPSSTDKSITNADGAFSISTTPGHDHRVSAHLDGLVGSAQVGMIEEGDDRYNVTIRLEEGREVRGTVVNPETGQRVGDTHVVWSASGIGLLVTVPVDEDGDFVATGVPRRWEPARGVHDPSVPSGHVSFFVHDRERSTELHKVGLPPGETTIEVPFVPRDE